MRLLTAGSLVRVQLGEPKKADTLMRIGFSFAILLTRTNDKLLQICLQIWEKQSGGLFRSRLHSLRALIFTFINGDIAGRCGHRPYIFMFFIEHDYKKAGGSYPPLRVQEQFIGDVPQESPL